MEKSKKVEGSEPLLKRLAQNRNFSTTLALFILCIFLTIVSRNFLSVSNIVNVLIQTTVNGVLACGVMLIIITGGTDLSAGRILGFAGIVTALVAKSVDPALGIAAGLLAGVLLGTVNGLVVTKLKIAPFIATLGMQSIAYGLTLVLCNSSPISGMPKLIVGIAKFKVFGFIPILVILTVIAMIATGFILKYTQFGRVLYGIGGNEEATRLSGINVDRNKLKAYMWGGLMAGIAGIMLTSRLNSAQPTAGFGYELDAIAAAVIGGTSMSGGVGTAIGTLLGALVLSVIRNGLNLLSVPTTWQQVVIGVVIIGAVFLDNLKSNK
jgi:ribose/xylose/arabinose/galactoside ABC-type transport system permease subunit